MNGFLPPGGIHDSTCEYLCRDVKTTCKHSCKVCDEKRRREGRAMRLLGQERPLLLLVLLALTACGDMGGPTTAPSPDAGALPTCPATCVGFCSAAGVCTCDDEQCQRAEPGFGDAGIDATVDAF